MLVLTILSRSWPGNLGWARLSKVRPPKSSQEFVVLCCILLTFPLGRLKLSSRFLSYPLFEHRVSAMSRQNVSQFTRRGEFIPSFNQTNLSTPNFDATNAELEVARWLIRISDAGSRSGRLLSSCLLEISSVKFGVIDCGINKQTIGRQFKRFRRRVLVIEGISKWLWSNSREIRLSSICAMNGW